MANNAGGMFDAGEVADWLPEMEIEVWGYTGEALARCISPG